MTDLFRKHKTMIANVASQYFTNPADAEDAMQEVWIKLSNTVIENVEKEAALVRVIVANFFKDLYNKDKRMRELDQEAAIFEDIDENDPQVLARRAEEGTEYERTIDNMPDDIASTARMYYIQGMSYGAISAALRIPEGTVASRLSRARAYFNGEE